ncbi:MAG: DUF5009 domain-containing protein [Bacteroides sp.]|nr:DUF5009 domain-containing protein [Bacteroides sp.]
MKTARIATIDVFRAITMFLMLFVNDIPGLRQIPHWMLHARMDEDMLGFSDIIFPCFLFVMGMSVPFAILKREEKGDAIGNTLKHIIERTFALVIMGLFTVNLGSYDGAATGLPYAWYVILLVVSIFLIWNLYPKSTGIRKRLFQGMKIAGILLMIGLFCIFEGKNGAVFAPKWWGILGLIGWTYLVTSIVFLIVRTRLVYMALAWLVFMSLSVLTHSGVMDLSFLPSDMTHHALGVSGAFASVLLIHYGNKEKPSQFIGWMIGLGILMLVLFFVSHPYWIISKIQATPTWLFVCNSISFFLVALLYYLTDVKGKVDWFMIIKPAGTVTLTCYMIPYFWYAVQRLVGFHYPDFLCAGVPGLCRSLLFSLVIVWIAGALTKVNVRLKI